MGHFHVLSTRQFANPTILHRLFDLALEMERNVKSEKLYPSLTGKVLATLFYEPSTRTRFSFESAMHRLGGRVISTEAAGQFSSVTKGETLEDTIRIVGGYADAMVLRHPEKGSAERASLVSPVPIINAGDGDGEHPTQALLDAYTIWREKKKLNDLNIILMGDLKYGRTIHSLITLLSRYRGNNFTLVSPASLQLPEHYLNKLHENNTPITILETLPDDLSDTDVLYMTRVQKERFDTNDDYMRVRDCCLLTREHVAKLPKDGIIMHPLPRVNEIDHAIDDDPRAAYFRQATNGLFVRMALLELLFERKTLEQENLRDSPMLADF